MKLWIARAVIALFYVVIWAFLLAMCYVFAQEYGWEVPIGIGIAGAFVYAVLWAFDTVTKEKVRKYKQRYR
jgi:uncharacterized integral membrane protein